MRIVVQEIRQHCMTYRVVAIIVGLSHPQCFANGLLDLLELGSSDFAPLRQGSLINFRRRGL